MNEPTVSPAMELSGAEGIRSLARLQRLVDVPSRWTLLALGLWVVWRTRGDGPTLAWAIVAGAYALIASAATLYWFDRGRTRGSRLAPAFAYFTSVIDALFIGALIWRDGGLASPLYILLVLLALRTAGLAPHLPGIAWLPFLSGPLYALVLGLAGGNLGFLADRGFQTRYVLLWVWLVGVTVLAVELARRTVHAGALSTALAQQRAALAQKTEVLQRTATDLGDRVLELRSLQEVARSLATTLGIDEALAVVVQRLKDMSGNRACAVALLEVETGEAGDGGRLRGMAQPAGARTPVEFESTLPSEPATAEAALAQRVVHVSAASDRASTIASLIPGSYMVAPLIARGRTMGALYVGTDGVAAGDPDAMPVTEQLLASFGYFAATAIENARLYQDAWEKRQELEAVLAGIGDGVVVVNPSLGLILMNPVARSILGLATEPLAGASLRGLLPAPAFADMLEETLAGGADLIRELEMAVNDEDRNLERDEPRTYGALASPVRNAAGEMGGVVAVLRDITAQKELERMKSNFLSVVSHELRTPLHSIKGFVEIILMGKTGPVSELQEDFLRTVRSQTTALQRMIDDLLEFSRMEAGRVRLHLTDVPIPAMAQAVASKLAPLADEASLRLYLDMQPDLPDIQGDRIRLEQVLTNLVENAIKFTPAGGEVTVAAEATEERVRIVVADTGIGIPPEEQSRVFDRFYQVDGSERRSYRGAGLGLSICKHIVERHRGRIWAESEGVPGHGTRFVVELPVLLRMEEAPTIDFTTPAR